ncbi:MAG TPA: hypothetical protein VGQ36_20605 [Thermoanaerobaculia bacterium]|jgi:hypothetical protein|nr:hypothetical protein [Thermoanaerobaculia bacterium]
MTHTDRSTFLRRLLIADAAISAATGVLLFAAAGLLERWLGLPAPLLRYAGFSLFPFAALVFYFGKRDVLSRTGVWTIIVINAVWVVASVALLLAGNVEPSPLGYAVVVLQAIVVAAIAELEYMGLRRVA